MEWTKEFEEEFQLLTFERKEVDFMNGKYWMNFPMKNEIKQFISTQIEKAKQEERGRIKKIIKEHKTKNGQWIIEDLINLI